MIKTEETDKEKTNKNILSKKALDQLNQTQKMFPFQRSLSKKAAFDVSSNNS